MKTRYLILLFAFFFNFAWADFSSTKMWFHPFYIVNEPFILDFRGEWPTDCHPGEQKPVITEYTGDSVLIEFEIIVEHIVCNDTPTPYRVLVDMSDVIDDVPGEFPFIDVTMRFGGDEFVKTLDKDCSLLCDPPPPPRDIKPEAGLYYSEGLEKQGLLLARQNQRMGAYPLIYDDAGSSEWVLGPGGIVEDVFFAELFESTGGQCLGCPPPDEPPQMGVVGKISMLMDSEGVIQVKINDGMFTTYEPIVYGYGEVNIGGNPTVNIPDLSGRWAFVESDIWPSLGTPPPTSILPLVFDINLNPPPTIGTLPPIVLPPGTPPAGNASYWVRDIEGEIVAEMRCEYQTTMVCQLDNDDNPDGFAARLLSPERMILTSLSPKTGSGKTGKGTAVRID